MKWKIWNFLFCLHCAGILMVESISPQIQTSVFKGVPDNWASSIDIDPFVKIGQKYYFIETKNAASWFEAAHECRRRNANLASIESAAEFDELQKYFDSRGGIMLVWTSGNDLIKEGDYYWMGTGNRIGYARWANAEPDNNLGNENCLLITYNREQYCLSDWICTSKAQYICEAKTPTTVALTLW